MRHVNKKILLLTVCCLCLFLLGCAKSIEEKIEPEIEKIETPIENPVEKVVNETESVQELVPEPTPEPTLEPTPEPTLEPTPEPTSKPTTQPTISQTTTQPQTSDKTYYIRVNRLVNCVTIYGKDENGLHTVPIKAMVCSVGKNINKTPTGVFKTTAKYVWRELYGNQYGQYATRFNGSILFHSVPYAKQTKDSLKTDYYNNLGEGDSMGCVRLSCADAKWIYDNCELGTVVEVYDDATTPGPLGKPQAIKIDVNSPYAGWDPTDPDEANPWNIQVTPPEEEQETIPAE